MGRWEHAGYLLQLGCTTGRRKHWEFLMVSKWTLTEMFTSVPLMESKCGGITI
ncbi:hypothetical protein M758_7G019200 [Ceratodon purpureus]|nr:hypothetical protein M758_7G019200 [Ceratodon purpureus]